MDAPYETQGKERTASCLSMCIVEPYPGPPKILQPAQILHFAFKYTKAASAEFEKLVYKSLHTEIANFARLLLVRVLCM